MVAWGTCPPTPPLAEGATAVGSLPYPVRPGGRLAVTQVGGVAGRNGLTCAGAVEATAGRRELARTFRGRTRAPGFPPRGAAGSPFQG